jgi:hypothetical protein
MLFTNDYKDSDSLFNVNIYHVSPGTKQTEVDPYLMSIYITYHVAQNRLK